MDKIVVFAIILGASGTLTNDIFRNDGELFTAITSVISSVATSLNTLI